MGEGVDIRWCLNLWAEGLFSDQRVVTKFQGYAKAARQATGIVGDPVVGPGPGITAITTLDCSVFWRLV